MLTILKCHQTASGLTEMIWLGITSRNVPSPGEKRPRFPFEILVL
jgi:hypothetical protein